MTHAKLILTIAALAIAAPACAETATLTLHSIAHSAPSVLREAGPLGLAGAIALLAGVVAYRIRRAR